jgi:hypothetical protein
VPPPVEELLGPAPSAAGGIAGTLLGAAGAAASAVGLRDGAAGAGADAALFGPPGAAAPGSLLLRDPAMMIMPDMDPLARARLEWALDGNVETP